jgi:hypothetical protein
MASMLGKLACMRLRSGRHLKPGREKRVYKRAQRAREKNDRRTREQRDRVASPCAGRDGVA